MAVNHWISHQAEMHAKKIAISELCNVRELNYLQQDQRAKQQPGWFQADSVGEGGDSWEGLRDYSAINPNLIVKAAFFCLEN